MRRLTRTGVWLLTMLLAWLWFSTGQAEEACINDGLDGICEERR